jgi:flotillin
MQSRTEVAENMKRAQIAEIDAKRDTDLQQQQARQDVGLRTVEADRAVQVANQQALQLVKEQERATKEREMAVVQVADVQRAEIDKSVNLVKAEQDRQATILIAEGQLEAKRREAQGIAAEGQARADAEKAMQLAPVEAQIVLAKEIGTNEGYQKYLVTIRQVEAAQAVGMEQAKALEQAEVKVIANTGEPLKGVTQVMELFSAKGGTEIGAMLEALAQTDEGRTLLSRIGAANGAAEPPKP